MFQMLLLLFSVLALAVIALTMLMSCADLKLKGLRWNVRRIGFVLAGAGAVGLLYATVFKGYHPDRYTVALEVGVALILITNPFQLPWHKWIWRGSSGGVA